MIYNNYLFEICLILKLYYWEKKKEYIYKI